jgi:hypothetical protein
VCKCRIPAGRWEPDRRRTGVMCDWPRPRDKGELVGRPGRAARGQVATLARSYLSRSFQLWGKKIAVSSAGGVSATDTTEFSFGPNFFFRHSARRESPFGDGTTNSRPTSLVATGSQNAMRAQRRPQNLICNDGVGIHGRDIGVHRFRRHRCIPIRPSAPWGYGVGGRLVCNDGVGIHGCDIGIHRCDVIDAYQ